MSKLTYCIFKKASLDVFLNVTAGSFPARQRRLLWQPRRILRASPPAAGPPPWQEGISEIFEKNTNENYWLLMIFVGPEPCGKHLKAIEMILKSICWLSVVGLGGS